MGNKTAEGMVSVKVLKPFHVGIVNPVHYKPGDEVELTEKVAKQALAQGKVELVK